jgi:hypothetical protein
MSSGAQDEMREFLDKVKSMGPLPEDWKKLYDQWEAVVNPQQQTATAAVGLPVSSASAGDTKANMA